MKWLLRLLVPSPLRRRIERLRCLVEDIWLPVYRIDQDGLVTIQIGRESPDPYVIRLLYGKYLIGAKVGNTLVWNLGRTVRCWEATADLILFRSARFQPSVAVARRMLMLPYYVQQMVPLPPATSDLFAHFYSHNSATRKSDLNAIRKANFQYEITQDPELLECFYHHLYVPFIQERHSESADFYDWPAFKVSYRDMELLLIRKDNRIVAGIVNEQIGNVYRLHVAATVSGDQDLRKAGGMSSLYWFSFVEAHRRGCLEVDTGAARPFLKDGVLLYKKKWTSQLAVSMRKRNLGLWLLPCSNPSIAVSCPRKQSVLLRTERPLERCGPPGGPHGPG